MCWIGKEKMAQVLRGRMAFLKRGRDLRWDYRMEDAARHGKML